MGEPAPRSLGEPAAGDPHSGAREVAPSEKGPHRSRGRTTAPYSLGDPTVCPPASPATDTVPNPPGTQQTASNGNLSSADVIKCTKVTKLGARGQSCSGWKRFLFFTVGSLGVVVSGSLEGILHIFI